MKKDEIQVHQSQYCAFMSEAFAADHDSKFREAIRISKLAWPHVDGMLQFEKKYDEKKLSSVSALDLVLLRAPVLLDLKALSEASEFIATCRRIERDTCDYAVKLIEAKESLYENHRLWNFLDRAGEAIESDLRSQLGGEQKRWNAIAEAWAQIGLISRVPRGSSHRLSFSLRLGQIVKAKCSNCGHIADAPKSMFFEPLTCDTCEKISDFVLVRI